MDIREIVEILPYLIIVCSLISAICMYWVEHNASEIFTGHVPDHNSYKSEMADIATISSKPDNESK